ncbi:LPS-assembly lipoprotein [Tranquillimonas rosea]|uniref:LPS-assembly lipoprotein n=1 Tax=Tranquillimonas rosea TaxID=641238 RepID=A0A1H9U638_9RHOB|nr:LPS assembly lipoprotein LptE [Tranquillimonas rosea]SES04782.1 LPS-assembly lipoprotein [Tranquillimonas rosea]
MSWYSRRSALLGLTLLAGCGFTPVYGPGGAAEGLWGRIEIDAPEDAAGYALVQQLEQRLGRASAAEYQMSAVIGLDQDGLGVTPDQEITRYQLRGQVTYALEHTPSGDTVTEGAVNSFTSYSAPVFTADRGAIAGNTVSVLSAEEDAVDRLMVILADQIVAELLATAPEWRR